MNFFRFITLVFLLMSCCEVSWSNDFLPVESQIDPLVRLNDLEVQQRLQDKNIQDLLNKVSGIEVTLKSSATMAQLKKYQDALDRKVDDDLHDFDHRSRSYNILTLVVWGVYLTVVLISPFIIARGKNTDAKHEQYRKGLQATVVVISTLIATLFSVAILALKVFL